MPDSAIPSPRRRGNPRWGNSSMLNDVPVQPSGWDRLLYRLRLKKDEDAIAVLRRGGDMAMLIKQWVRGNRNRFVPETILELVEEKEAVESQHWWGGLEKR
jgi:hypothetical protein